MTHAPTPPPDAKQVEQITDTDGGVIGWIWPGEHVSPIQGPMNVWFARSVQAPDTQVIGFDGAVRDDAVEYLTVRDVIAGRAGTEAAIVQEQTRRQPTGDELLV